ncbi:hypothetical protein [Methylobacterium sp. WL7]|uniref:DUF6414 family protein n=1 Tax=Methylobacterium sp. WL7 TaxID=2603900 RepID=UPI0011C81D4F|nr:hypothetical protein [Methylobacterium sp. WL7]TXN44629.1 hypothetical protein FV233_13975 [Methylobacterium sp. WL7]
MPSSETLPVEEIDSGADYEGPPPNSVYDFIYQDVRRIGSFLAQFEEHGVRQLIKATEAVSKTESTRSTASGTISVPLVGGGGGSVDLSAASENRDAAEYTFDPLWTNARRLLDYLTQHELLNKEIWETRLGSFVQLEGALAIIDPNLAKPIIKVKSIKETMRKSIVAGLSGTPGERNKMFDAFVDLIDVMQSSVQAHLSGSNFTAWSALSETALSITSSDLALKHGSFIPGRWTLVGILDAFPDPKAEPTPENPEPQTMDDVVAEFAGTMIGTMTAQITSVSRELVGRPRNFFGVTPLVIFREVSAVGSA